MGGGCGLPFSDAGFCCWINEGRTQGTWYLVGMGLMLFLLSAILVVL